MDLHLILGVAAAICFALGAFGVSARISLTDLGLLLLTLMLLVP